MHLRSNTLPISLLWTSTCQSNSSSFYHICPKPSPAHTFRPYRERAPCHFQALLSSTSLSLHFLHRSFHSLGALYHRCPSPVVTEREPGPRPLSLVHPTLQGAKRERCSPMHRPVVMRAHSLPSHGLKFPALQPAASRLVDGYREDDYGLIEYFC